MLKRILSIALMALLIVSFTVVAVSAEQVEIAAEGASDGVAAQGAEDSVAATGADTISFDAGSAGWNNFNTVYCHIWACDGTGSWPSWQSKKEKCDYDASTGIATYDLSNLDESIGDGANWACIFSNENGMQTYNLLLGAACIGDTAYCDGTTYENPEDSSKTAQAAFWKNQDSATYGPELAVTSIGNIVGTCCPGNTTKYGLMVKFLSNQLENARTYSGKDDQAIIDDAASALGLTKEDVEKAISEAGVTTQWDKSKSTLSGGSSSETTSTSGGSGSSSSSSSKSSSSSSGSSTSSTKSGSGASSTTGQDTTVVFIMLGVIAAAAVLIVVMRKRTKA